MRTELTVTLEEMTNEELLEVLAEGNMNFYEANCIALVMEQRFPSPPRENKMRLVTFIGRRKEVACMN